MPTTIYQSIANKKILPIYSLLFAWDEEVTGSESVFIEFRLLGDESQITFDGIMRRENGGNRVVGYKATANIYITEALIAQEHLNKILYEKPTRCFVDLRPYKTTQQPYYHVSLGMNNYDIDPTPERVELRNFSWFAFSRESTKDIYKTNIQITCLYGREEMNDFWPSI